MYLKLSKVYGTVLLSLSYIRLGILISGGDESQQQQQQPVNKIIIEGSMTRISVYNKNIP